MRLTRSHYVIYAVVLREHPEVVKLGRTTHWKSRRRAYDTWNFAPCDGVSDCLVYCLTDEYVDLAAVEKACLDGMALLCPIHRGNEWFKGSLADARKVIEGVLCAGEVSFIESEQLRAHKGAAPLRVVSKATGKP
jgi:hypothetical protein